MPRRFATQEQAAARFQVNPRTVRNWIAKGLITGFRLPGSRAIRVDIDEVERVMRTIPATVARPNKPAYGGARLVDLSRVVDPSLVVQEDPPPSPDVSSRAPGVRTSPGSEA